MSLLAPSLVASIPKIVRIIAVTDARSYEEQGDRWVPIPGSGQENECARCGRLHEAHATVELSDGSVVVVGTGCMAAEGVEIASRLRSGASRAKRIAVNGAGRAWKETTP